MEMGRESAATSGCRRYLLDTPTLIWAAGEPERLNDYVISILSNDSYRFYFSAVSIQEIAIKSALNRPDFYIDAKALTEGLIAAGYLELPVMSEHAYQLVGLPDMHRDPFDRMLVSQAKAEGLNLITNDGNIIKHCAGYIDLTACC